MHLMSHARNDILATACSSCSLLLMSESKKDDRMQNLMRTCAQALSQEAVLF